MPAPRRTIEGGDNVVQKGQLMDATPTPADKTTPADTKPIEKKVTASTVSTFIASVLLLAIVTAVDDANGRLINALPYPLGSALVALAPTVVTFLSGWLARHTPRPTPVPPQHRL